MATQLLPDPEIDRFDEKQNKTNLVDRDVGDTSARSALERFIDSFFHPANIKWMLVVGAAIVLGSSLMLVTKQWSDWSAAFKFLAMFGYTAAIWLFAEFGDRRLALKTTGKVLRGLTILLLPVLMFALGWVATQPSSIGLPISVEVGVLFLPAAALLAFAARSIFHHFLSGHQLTFVASYILLSVAGLLPRAEQTWLAFSYLALFWTILTVGVIKVNRHVFWLTEEHRLPRIFGFFPIVLLGCEFLLLCGTKIQFAVPPQWFGFATVMLASTILGTTRSIASVFKARTGDLVRPLPWSIALPLIVGVFLSFVGVSISFYGFRMVGTTTYAVVPTAIVAMCLLFAVAYDTRHWAFTALALFLLTIAYQCTPTLIATWVNILKASAASAIHEEKLPLAFYGITYFPLLALLTVSAIWLSNRRRKDISLPIQIYVTAITSLLWCISLSNFKAVLVVSAINIVSYTLYAIAFRDRRYVAGTLIGVVMVAATWVPFANSLYGLELSLNCVAISLSAVALILYARKIPDKLIENIPLPLSNLKLGEEVWGGLWTSMSNRLGFAMIATLGGLRLIWLASNLPDLSEVSSLSLDTLLVISFSWIAYRKLHYLAAVAATVIPIVGLVSHARHLGWTLFEIGDCLAIVSASVSTLGLLYFRFIPQSGNTAFALRNRFGIDFARFRVMESMPPSPLLSQRFTQWIQCHAIVLSDVATGIIACLGLMVFAPNILMLNMALPEANDLTLASLFVLGWLCSSTLLHRSRLAASAIAVIGPFYATAAVTAFWPTMQASAWTPVVWVSVSSILCLAFHFYARAEFAVASFICRVWLCTISAIGMVYLSLPIRIAVGIAVGTLLILRGHLKFRWEPMFIAILCNVHAFLFVVNFAGVEGWIFQEYTAAKLICIASALLPAMTLSLLVSDTALRRISVLGSEFWSTILRLLSAIQFVIVCSGPILPATNQLMIMGAIAIAIVCEFIAATRNHSEIRAWTTIATAGLVGFWAWDQNWLAFQSGIGQLILVVAAAISWWMSGAVKSNSKWNCFANPLSWIGLILPGIAATASIVFEVAARLPFAVLPIHTQSHSLNYLGLIAAATLYFFRGLHEGKNRFFVAAAALLNIGLALLWFANGLTDPQFYCVPVGLSIILLVELLKKELPSESRDPLRYVGALFILVSPVVGILGSGWLHMFSLLVMSVLVILLAIGFRIRSLMYTGTAFLLADLAGMLIRSTMDNTTLLWIGGVGLGGAVIVLAALCENHRENVLAKIRLLSAELATWN